MAFVGIKEVSPPERHEPLTAHYLPLHVPPVDRLPKFGCRKTPTTAQRISRHPNPRQIRTRFHQASCRQFDSTSDIAPCDSLSIYAERELERHGARLEGSQSPVLVLIIRGDGVHDRSNPSSCRCASSCSALRSVLAHSAWRFSDSVEVALGSNRHRPSLLAGDMYPWNGRIGKKQATEPDPPNVRPEIKLLFRTPNRSPLLATVSIERAEANAQLPCVRIDCQNRAAQPFGDQPRGRILPSQLPKHPVLFGGPLSAATVSAVSRRHVIARIELTQG